jgi:pilus assembly protein CpaB
MDRKFFTSVLASGAIAAVAAAMFYRFAAGATARPGQTTNVVYAITSLPIGARIRSSDVKLVRVPVTMKPRDSFARVEDAVDRPVIAAILQDEPVLKERLADPASGAGLAPIIPAGYRAAAVRVNDVIGVAGYAEPGMKVDVLVTGHPPGSEETVTRTVLQNIRVLSAGQVLQPEPNGQAIHATVVTLEVTPRDAELLTLATEGGHIQLVLRNSTDSASPQTPGARSSGMYGPEKASGAPPPQPPPARKRAAIEKPLPQPRPALATVEVIRGSHRSVETLAERQVDAP